MKKNLSTLINEKGQDTNQCIPIEGHFGLTWDHLIEYINQQPQYHQAITSMLVKIDFHNGDIFHYLTHLANGMIEEMGI